MDAFEKELFKPENWGLVRTAYVLSSGEVLVSWSRQRWQKTPLWPDCAIVHDEMRLQPYQFWFGNPEHLLSPHREGDICGSGEGLKDIEQIAWDITDPEAEEAEMLPRGDESELVEDENLSIADKLILIEYEPTTDFRKQQMKLLLLVRTIADQDPRNVAARLPDESSTEVLRIAQGARTFCQSDKYEQLCQELRFNSHRREKPSCAYKALIALRLLWSLSKRQLRIREMLDDDQSAEEIWNALGISRRTYHYDLGKIREVDKKISLLLLQEDTGDLSEIGCTEYAGFSQSLGI